MKIKHLSVGLITLALLAVAAPVHSQEKAEGSGPDGGANAVRIFERAGGKLPSLSLVASKGDSVKNLITNELRSKGLKSGAMKNGGYIAVTSYEFPLQTLDPSDIIVKRTLAFQGAYVRGAAEICNYLATTADSNVKLSSPGTPMHREFAEKIAKLQVAESELRARATALGVELDKVEQQSLAGVQLKDRAAAACDALIKKLDSKYDPEKVQAQKDAKVKQLRDELATARKESETISKNIDTFETDYRKHTISSESTAYLDHSIVGITTLSIAQVITTRPNGTHVLDVGVATAWSPGLEKAARAMFNMGEDVVTAPPGQLSVDEFVEQRGNMGLPPMMSYTDKDGEKWFLGAGFGDRSVDGDEGDLLAQSTAMQNCLFSLFINTKGKRGHQMAASKGNKGSFTSQSAIEDLESSFKDLKISGLSAIMKAEVNYPLQDGQSLPLSVCVMGISAKSVVQAMKAEISLTDSEALRYHHDTFMKGREDARRAYVENAKNNAADYQKGVSHAQNGLPTAQGNEGRQSTSSQEGLGDQRPNGQPKLQEGKMVTPAVIPDDF